MTTYGPTFASSGADAGGGAFAHATSVLGSGTIGAGKIAASKLSKKI